MEGFLDENLNHLEIKIPLKQTSLLSIDLSKPQLMAYLFQAKLHNKILGQ